MFSQRLLWGLVIAAGCGVAPPGAGDLSPDCCHGDAEGVETSERFAGSWRTSDGEVTLACAGEPALTTPLSRSTFALVADGPARVILDGECPLAFIVDGRGAATDGETRCVAAGVELVFRLARIDLVDDDTLEVQRVIDATTESQRCQFVERWRAQKIAR